MRAQVRPIRSPLASLGAPLDRQSETSGRSLVLSRIHTRATSSSLTHSLSTTSPLRPAIIALSAPVAVVAISPHPSVDAPSSLFRILRAHRNPFAFAAALALAAAPLLSSMTLAFSATMFSCFLVNLRTSAPKMSLNAVREMMLASDKPRALPGVGHFCHLPCRIVASVRASTCRCIAKRKSSTATYTSTTSRKSLSMSSFDVEPGFWRSS